MSAKHGWRIALILMVVGILVCLAALAFAGFDFSRLSTGNYETRTVPVSEAFRSITVTGDTERIAFAPSADGTCSVAFRERENEPHTVTVEDGILTIENTSRNAWHFFDFSFFTDHPSITVYLPGTVYQALSVSSDTGDVEIPADFAFDSIQVHVSTGDVRCGASATGKVDIQTSTGSVSLAEMSAGEIRSALIINHCHFCFVSLCYGFESAAPRIRSARRSFSALGIWRFWWMCHTASWPA